MHTKTEGNMTTVYKTIVGIEYIIGHINCNPQGKCAAYDANGKPVSALTGNTFSNITDAQKAIGEAFNEDYGFLG